MAPVQNHQGTNRRVIENGNRPIFERLFANLSAAAGYRIPG